MSDEFAWHLMDSAPRDGTAILMVLAMPYKQQVALGEAPVLQVVIGDLYGSDDWIWSPDGQPVQVLRWAPLPPIPSDLPDQLDDLLQKDNPAP